MIYCKNNPFGDHEMRQDYRNAQLCQLLAEINRNPKKRAKPFRIEDFLLFRRPVCKTQKQSPEEALAIFTQIARRK